MYKRQAYTKDDYLVIPYLMGQRRYDEAIRLCEPRERFLIEHGDTINYHMMSVKRTLGRAYEARGDFKRAAAYFEGLAVLTDSLKRREQLSAAMDLAIANDVHEKEQQLQATAARLRKMCIRDRSTWSAACFFTGTSAHQYQGDTPISSESVKSP